MEKTAANIVLLDAQTLGKTSLESIAKLGKLTTYPTTAKNEILKRAQNAQIIITNKVVLDAATLAKLPNLRLICIAATGMNNVDLAAAKKLNIAVKNVAGYSTSAVAQHTLSTALGILGQQNYYDRFAKKGKWAKSEVFTHISAAHELFELAGKSWGIIGFGSIGQRVGAIAKAFGAEVCYFSTSGANDNKNFKRAENLCDLLKNCDIISIHSPLNDKTKNLIAKKELGLLKKGAILINMGRGGIVNENDLAKALKKRDFYFATDVLEVEPMAKNHPFLDKKIQDKLIITPHIAWAYKEARARLVAGVEKNIREFLG